MNVKLLAFSLIGLFIGSVIGSFLGYVAFGAIGGLVLGAGVWRLESWGIAVGAASGGGRGINDTTDFVLSALILAAAVVRSDGNVEELELSYIRSFLAEQFGSKNIDDYMLVLEESIQEEFELKKTAQQIRQSTSYETRLQILYFLFGIANADYNIDDSEIATIKIVSIHLGMNSYDYTSIKAMFYSEMDSFYKILEVSPSAPDSEVRSAYKFMMQKYHPDKLMHLGEGIEKIAKEKHLKVQEAYDKIKAKRGFR